MLSPMREFHVRREARDRYQIDRPLIGAEGDLVTADLAGIRRLAARMNDVRPIGPSVQAGEIGALAEDLLEAGRAQAIAARSYTLFYLGRRADEGFDLYGTVEDQVYGPLESEKPLATRCVTSTRGQVSLSDGWPIRANYCGTCGGISAEVWEAWPPGTSRSTRSVESPSEAA